VSHLRAVAVSDAGRVRPTNQDIAYTADDLIAVADGMGGHAAGDTAARIAIDTLVSAFERPADRDSLIEAARTANTAVFEESARREELHGMGTTLTAAAVVRAGATSELVIVNVGDSRAYMLSGETIVQLTEDHSLVEQLVRQGELTAEEAAVHPHRHILTRAIGIDLAVEIDSWVINPRDGTRLLICSDGLTNECSEEEIATVLRDHLDPGDAADDLVRRALAHGGNDNVTVVVADVEADAPIDEDPAEALAREVGDVRRPEGLAPTGPLVRARARASNVARIASEPSTPRHNEHILTPRVVLFVLLLVATLGGVIGFTVWFDKATYYVGIDNNHVAIFQGRPGGMLWFHPSLVERSPTPVSAVLDADLPLLRAGVLEPSYPDAERVATNLENETNLLGISPTTTTIAPTTTTVARTIVTAATTTTVKGHGTTTPATTPAATVATTIPTTTAPVATAPLTTVPLTTVPLTTVPLTAVPLTAVP
jgi:protein phosphatase